MYTKFSLFSILQNIVVKVIKQKSHTPPTKVWDVTSNEIIHRVCSFVYSNLYKIKEIINVTNSVIEFGLHIKVENNILSENHSYTKKMHYKLLTQLEYNKFNRCISNRRNISFTDYFEEWMNIYK